MAVPAKRLRRLVRIRPRRTDPERTGTQGFMAPGDVHEELAALASI